MLLANTILLVRISVALSPFLFAINNAVEAVVTLYSKRLHLDFSVGPLVGKAKAAIIHNVVGILIFILLCRVIYDSLVPFSIGVSISYQLSSSISWSSISANTGSQSFNCFGFTQGAIYIIQSRFIHSGRYIVASELLILKVGSFLLDFVGTSAIFITNGAVHHFLSLRFWLR